MTTSVLSIAFGILLLAPAVISCDCGNELYSKIPGGLRHATTSDNYLWGVNANDDIFVCNRPCTGGWKKVDGKLMQIDAGEQEVWGVNSGHSIFKRPIDGSGDWVNIPGALIHVSASGNGYIWGVNKNDQIFKCKKPCMVNGFVSMEG